MRILPLILFLFTLCVSSCERCIECSATLGQTVKIQPEEYCGTRNYVDEREAAFEETCNLEKANNPGTQCQCLGKKK